MAPKLVEVIKRFLAECPHIISCQDHLTKTRLELENGYFLDLFYNETLGKYSYTLIKQNQRVVGWDNAPHHSQLSNFPHHFHAMDGTTQPSNFTGDPAQDIGTVINIVNAMFKDRS
jgi:hypothetical protein